VVSALIVYVRDHQKRIAGFELEWWTHDDTHEYTNSTNIAFVKRVPDG
jgi:hypothetical protein